MEVELLPLNTTGAPEASGLTITLPVISFSCRTAGLIGILFLVQSPQTQVLVPIL